MDLNWLLRHQPLAGHLVARFQLPSGRGGNVRLVVTHPLRRQWCQLPPMRITPFTRNARYFRHAVATVKDVYRTSGPTQSLANSV
jgi:hypothetical protein